VVYDSGVARWAVYAAVSPHPPPKVQDAEYLQWYRRTRGNREFHGWREILYCFDGECTVGWGDAAWLLRPGSILLVDRLELHARLYPPNAPPFRHWWFGLRQPSAHLSTIATPDERRLPTGILDIRSDSGLIYELQRAWDDAEEAKDRGEQDLAWQRLRSLAVASVYELEWRLRESQSPRSPYDDTIHRVVDYIDSHHHHDLTLDELAKLAGYSKYHFHRLFRRATGSTLHQYVTRRRVEHARYLLQAGYACRSVAEEMGFGDPSSFSQWYKANTGHSPSVEGSKAR
jgi:AraC-like DNA-binding protein